MYIISVTPFSKGIKKESLSYFSSKPIEPGKIVTVPLRKSSARGLVIKCSDGKNFKQQLKKATFEIKKIKGVAKNSLLSQVFILAAQETANFFATSPGAIIGSLVPKKVLDEPNKFQYKSYSCDKKTNAKKEDSVRSTTTSPKYIIQSPDSERYSDYKSLIRTQFAKNKSVFFCVPTIEDTFYADSILSKGIEKSTYVFHSKTTKQQIEKNWNNITTSARPVLIICTGSFLSIPRNDIGAVIVERENSGAYRTLNNPFFDIRRFAEIYAQNAGALLIFGDLLLRAETLWRYDQQEFIEYTPIKFRSLNTARGKVIDMKKVRKQIKGKKSEYQILSEQLEDLLLDAHNKSKKTFLLASRKGLSPVVVCNDCGEIVKCDHCSSPVVLYAGKISNGTTSHSDPRIAENHFKCHHCSSTRSAGETCKNCGGWNLNMLGCGIDKVVEKVAELVPEDNLFILDKDRARTHKKARDIIQKFKDSPSGVLIGTEMALLYLNEEIENVGVVTVDSMFSIPDFQIKERILNILLRAKSKALDNFYIQTRNSDNPVFDEAVKGNLADFYRQEFIERKKFNYPPFSILIKISGFSESRKKLEKDFGGIANFLSPTKIQVYPAFTEIIKGKFRINGLIRIPRDEWIDKNLSDKLRQLPNQFRVEIDSQSVI